LFYSENPVLTNYKTYSVFVRAWYKSNEFAVYKSAGLTIIHSHPISMETNDNKVKEVLQRNTVDVDFVSKTKHLQVDLAGIFTDSSLKYNLFIRSEGTYFIPMNPKVFCLITL
jgi:hypothetical protein